MSDRKSDRRTMLKQAGLGIGAAASGTLFAGAAHAAEKTKDRQLLESEVLVVGGGPAGIGAAPEMPISTWSLKNVLLAHITTLARFAYRFKEYILRRESRIHLQRNLSRRVRRWWSATRWMRGLMSDR